MRKTNCLLLSVGLYALGSNVALAASVVQCNWLTPEYPHISSFNLRNGGSIDIKTSTQGECTASTDPIFVTAEMTLEKNGVLPFLWSTFATGVPITKSVQNTAQIWRRGELFAVAPCVPGTYRGTLNRTAKVVGGVGFLLGDDIFSPGVEIDCKPKRISMVIDDTGSMSAEIGSVASALSTYINARPEDEYTNWNLTTFKDSPTNVGSTEERSEILGLVGGLRASGGGDCPEDALGGITTGMAALGTDPNTNKQMIVATDASAQDGDVDGIIANARGNGVRVNVLLTGDCGLEGPAAMAAPTISVSLSSISSQLALKRIADETGGKYFFIPGGTAAEFTSALNEIFANIANPAPVDTLPPTIELSVTPNILYPPNHKMVEIFPTVSAIDNLDPKPSLKLVGVDVSEPDNGQGDGNTENDVKITPEGRIFVRSERSGNNTGRIYAITYSATDAAGNTAYASATVVVPKNKAKK